MKLNFVIAVLLSLTVHAVSASETNIWSCESADKSVSLMIAHTESSYTADALVTVAGTIRVPMPCTLTPTKMAFICLENNDQVERLGAALSLDANNDLSGSILIHNKVTGIQKFSDITCLKSK